MPKKQIIIIDDELMLLLSMQRMLEDEFDITIANGGQKALDTLSKREKWFDLIICDLNMPDINGQNLYLDIAKKYPGLEKRIVFMTGGSITSELEKFFVSNKCLCLPKPFEYSKLLQAINDSLESNHT